MLRSPRARSTCARPSTTSGAPGRMRPARSKAAFAAAKSLPARLPSPCEMAAANAAPDACDWTRARPARGRRVWIQLQHLAVGRLCLGGRPAALERLGLRQQALHLDDAARTLEAAPGDRIRRLDLQCQPELPARLRLVTGSERAAPAASASFKRAGASCATACSSASAARRLSTAFAYSRRAAAASPSARLRAALANPSPPQVRAPRTSRLSYWRATSAACSSKTCFDSASCRRSGADLAAGPGCAAAARGRARRRVALHPLRQHEENESCRQREKVPSSPPPGPAGSPATGAGRGRTASVERRHCGSIAPSAAGGGRNVTLAAGARSGS